MSILAGYYLETLSPIVVKLLRTIHKPTPIITWLGYGLNIIDVCLSKDDVTQGFKMNEFVFLLNIDILDWWPDGPGLSA